MMDIQVIDITPKWYIGSKAECEAKAAELGYVIDKTGNDTIAHAIRRTPESIGYIHSGNSSITGLLIKYNVAGQWCFQYKG
jgi:ABC-type phosphate transport system substrate-binding protein